MAESWINDVERWKWNWTELCGRERDISPLNPETHDLNVCFQQLCLQVIKVCFVLNFEHTINTINIIIKYLFFYFLDSSISTHSYNFCILLWKKKYIFI